MKKIIFSTFFLMLALCIQAQTFVVQGTITLSDGGVASHAIIKEKFTSNQIIADSLGRFRLHVTSPKAVLVVNAMGYMDKEVKLNGQQKMNIRLERNNKALAELAEINIAAHQKQTKMVQANVQTGMMMLVGGYNPIPAPPPPIGWNTEGYDRIQETGFRLVKDQPLSTFSIDVDGAAYSNVRRLIKNGSLPPDGAVRIEEMINYFTYDYAQPTGNAPVVIHTELTTSPWNKDNRLLMIGLQAKKMDVTDLPPANLVFLVDVSGSMFSPNKLPLVKSSLHLLVNQLRPSDQVTIVTYAGSANAALTTTHGNQKSKIREAIDRMEAGGGTAGAAGIQLAYKLAQEQFLSKGNNRVILCTDGDFNIGVSSDDELERLIEMKRNAGVFLSVLGFGMGNYQDAKLQKLANKGNGNHAYIDDIMEARKVFVHEFGGTLFTIAKDVKLQLEFNAQHVKGYRLIGYENRRLSNEDFNNDAKDAGEMGSGHTVTAIYELVLPGNDLPGTADVDSLKYQSVKHLPGNKDELLTIKMRYKDPDGEASKKIETVVRAQDAIDINKASTNVRFAASVASFGLTLSNSAYKGTANHLMALELAKHALGTDKDGYRREFVDLIERTMDIDAKNREREKE